MGRPPKNPEDRKKYQLHVPLTEAQRALIAEAVRLDGEDKAAWARAILLEAAKRRVGRRGTAQADQS
jgi:hypothetical protein